MRYYATLGPNCNQIDCLKKMKKIGVDGFRLNLSHDNLYNKLEWIENVKRVNDNFEIILDIKGPEIRININKCFNIKKGDIIKLRALAKDKLLDDARDLILEENTIYIEKKYYKSVSIGDEILIDDSKVKCKVIERKEDYFLLLSFYDSKIENKKSLTFEGKSVIFDVFSDEDLLNIKMASQLKITSFMQPFVRCASDCDKLRSLLKDSGIINPYIYAKVEDSMGLDNIDEIIRACDCLVIARGDLGNNIGLTKVARVQKNIAQKCKKYYRDFMVVTQLLDSMVQRPVPTRAEVNDIYNSVLDGASHLMLTQETAIGKYPCQAMKYLIEIGDLGEKDV